MPLTSIITLERVFRTASRVAPFTNPLRFKKASGDEQRGWHCVRSEARIFAKPFSATGNFPSDQEPQLLPDQSACSKAGKRQWEKFLHSCRLWRTESGPRRMELFAKATEFCGSEPTARAKSMLALSFVKMLFALENQLTEYRKADRRTLQVTSRSRPVWVLTWRQPQARFALVSRDRR